MSEGETDSAELVTVAIVWEGLGNNARRLGRLCRAPGAEDLMVWDVPEEEIPRQILWVERLQANK